MASRLAVDAHGRRIAVVTAPAVGLEVGMRFVVLGDGITCAGDGFYFTGERTGRAPLIDEKPRRTGGANVARGTPRKWSDADRERAVELVVGGGLSWSAAAEEIGCTKASVGDWVRRADVSRTAISTGELEHRTVDA